MLPANPDTIGIGDRLVHMTRSTRPARRKKQEATSHLLTAVAAALDDMKAVNVKVLDVRGVADFADTLYIVSGNSDRHVRSIADRVVEKAKAAGARPIGVEGTRDGEWVLVDLNDVIVHVMLPRVREFYGLERLWETDAPAVVVASPARAKKPRKKASKPAK
jgi:ribosome-associated protein